MQGGNWVGLVSSYQTWDGKTHELADVWLQSGDVSDPQSRISGMAEVMAAFVGHGNTGDSGDLVLAVDEGVGASPGLVARMAQVLSLCNEDGRPMNLTGVNVLGENPEADENLRRGVLASGQSSPKRQG
ncbi:hypothetical protein CCP4SC76_6110001 [Gammaproteobacteria bacterium]